VPPRTITVFDGFDMLISFTASERNACDCAASGECRFEML
jgi:hypothetical protein